MTTKKVKAPWRVNAIGIVVNYVFTESTRHDVQNQMITLLGEQFLFEKMVIFYGITMAVCIFIANQLYLK